MESIYLHDYKYTEQWTIITNLLFDSYLSLEMNNGREKIYLKNGLITLLIINNLTRQSVALSIADETQFYSSSEIFLPFFGVKFQILR